VSRAIKPGLRLQDSGGRADEMESAQIEIQGLKCFGASLPEPSCWTVV